MKTAPVQESPGCPAPSNRSSACPLPPQVPAISSQISIRRILVPIDFSPCSIKALEYATPLASQFCARLCLLHVTEGCYPISPLGPVDLASAKALSRGDAAGQLAQLATREIARHLPVDIIARNGYPPKEIVRAAREFYADLIVISTHGYTGLKHTWFGSVAESLVRDAPCPVLVVREREHEFISSAPAPEDDVVFNPS